MATTIRLSLAALLAIVLSMFICGFLLDKASRRVAFTALIVVAVLLFSAVLAVDHFFGR